MMLFVQGAQGTRAATSPTMVCTGNMSALPRNPLADTMWQKLNLEKPGRHTKNSINIYNCRNQAFSNLLALGRQARSATQST